jgi:flavorubredoxin
MPIIDSASGSRVEEIAAGVFQIHLPVPPAAAGEAGFSFNQYLIVDDEPLLFHTGPRRMSRLVAQAIASVMPLARLRYIAYSHCESDECGGMNELLAAAPRAEPVTGAVGAMLNGDLADRPTRALADGEALPLGRATVRWLDTPHLPHGWECGYLFEEQSRTLLCGDLFTQPGCGAATPALTAGDVLTPSEALRGSMDYFAHAPASRALLERLAATGPRTLACMHGSAWAGDGAALLRELAGRLARDTG